MHVIMLLHIIQSPSSIVKCLWEEVFTYSDFWPEPWGRDIPSVVAPCAQSKHLMAAAAPL